MSSRTPHLRALLALLILATALVSAGPTAAADLKSDLIADLDQLESKIVGLAKAIPAEKYSWRPAEGIRSVSEAFMHTAGANYFFPTRIGAAPPEGVNLRNLEQITDKDEVISTLEASFAFLRAGIENTPPERLSETMNAFGQEVSVAGFLHSAVSHSHEHLGQLIAYARTNGITPPWSQ